MINVKAYVAAVLMMFSGGCAAHGGDSLDSFIEKFYADFSDRNLESLSKEYFYKDAHAIFGEHISVLSGDAAVRGMFVAILEGLERKGYNRSVVRKLTKTHVTDHYAHAMVLFDRVKVDGEKLDTMCSSYAMFLTKDGWRFLSWVPSEPVADDRCL